MECLSVCKLKAISILFVIISEITSSLFTSNQLTSSQGIEEAATEDQSDVSKPQRMQSVSISMPPSPIEAHIHNTKRVLFRDDPDTSAASSNHTKQHTKFYSQPIPKGSALNEPITNEKPAHFPSTSPRIHKLRDKRFDSFKTWSGKLERQISNLRGGNRDDQDPRPHQRPERANVPVHRYYDALEGPELDVLRVSRIFSSN